MKRQSNDPIKGLAKVQISKPSGKQIKVSFLATDKNPNPKSYTVLSSQAPEYVKEGTYLVKMDSAGEKIYSTSPAEGMFQVHVEKYFAKENQPPTWATYTGMGKNGVYDYKAFSIGLLVTKGKEAGMPISAFLRYHFEEDRDNPGIVVLAHPKSKYTDQLDDFLTVSGAIKSLDNGSVKYSDNILPSLEKVHNRYGKDFVVLMKAGYIDKFLPLMIADIEGDPENEDNDPVGTGFTAPEQSPVMHPGDMPTTPDAEVLEDDNTSGDEPPFDE